MSSTSKMASSIKKRVRDLIRSVDLEQFTERKLRKQLGEEFGQSQVEEHGALIKETVNSELERLAGDGDGAEDEAAEEEAPPAKKAKKVAQAAAGALSTQPDGSVVLSLPQLRKVSVRSFKGRAQVDLREWYEVRGRRSVRATAWRS